jgi:penicillin-binding protein 1A
LRLIPVKPVHQRVLAWLATLAVGLAGAVAIASLSVYYYLAPTLPEVAQLRDIRLQVPLRVY